MSNEINYDELVEEEVPVTDDELKSISALAERQMKLEDWIEKQEAKIKEAKKRLAKVTSEELPDALRAAGVKEFVLANGAELNLDTKIRANITKANQEAAYDWLRNHGGADILRTKFDLSFGASEDAQAEDFAEKLEALGLDFNQNTNVPWNSLDAFIRCEMKENEHGEDWENLFGVYRHTAVKIVRPKT